MKAYFTNFQLHKKECGFLFIFSIIYNLIYLFLSRFVYDDTALTIFLILISLLFTEGWYFICLKLWDMPAKIKCKEGVKVMAFQGIYILLTFIMQHLMYAWASSAAGLIVTEVVNGLLFLMYPYALMTFFYHLATKEKIYLQLDLLRLGMLMMIVIVIGDTLLNGALTIGSMDLWTLLYNLMFQGNPWINWIMMVTIGMVYQASAGMMLISMVVYFFLGLFYALLEINYAASVKRVMKAWNSLH